MACSQISSTCRKPWKRRQQVLPKIIYMASHAVRLQYSHFAFARIWNLTNFNWFTNRDPPEINGNHEIIYCTPWFQVRQCVQEFLIRRSCLFICPSVCDLVSGQRTMDSFP
jgi:hypothetical protein